MQSLFLCLCKARLARGIVYSTCPFVCLSVCSFISLLPNFWTRYFEKEWTDFDVNLHKWSTGKGMKQSTMRVRSQSSRSHKVSDGFGGLTESHSQPLGSSSFSTRLVSVSWTIHPTPTVIRYCWYRASTDAQYWHHHNKKESI